MKKSNKIKDRHEYKCFVEKWNAKAYTEFFNDILNVTIDHDSSAHLEQKKKEVETNSKVVNKIIENLAIKNKNNAENIWQKKNKKGNFIKSKRLAEENLEPHTLDRQYPVEEIKVDNQSNMSNLLLNYFKYQQNMIQKLSVQQNYNKIIDNITNKE